MSTGVATQAAPAGRHSRIEQAVKPLVRIFFLHTTPEEVSKQIRAAEGDGTIALHNLIENCGKSIDEVAKKVWRTWMFQKRSGSSFRYGGRDCEYTFTPEDATQLAAWVLCHYLAPKFRTTVSPGEAAFAICAWVSQKVEREIMKDKKRSEGLVIKKKDRKAFLAGEIAQEEGADSQETTKEYAEEDFDVDASMVSEGEVSDSAEGAWTEPSDTIMLDTEDNGKEDNDGKSYTKEFLRVDSGLDEDLYEFTDRIMMKSAITSRDAVNQFDEKMMDQSDLKRTEQARGRASKHLSTKRASYMESFQGLSLVG